MKKSFSKGVAVALALMLMLVMFAGCQNNSSGGSSTATPPPATTGNTGDAPKGDPIVLSFVTFIPQNHPQIVTFQREFIDVINEKANGELIFEFKGGPDTFAPMDMGAAAQSGSVDAAFCLVGSYESMVPAITGMMLSQLEPEEELDSAYDYLQEIHHAGGLHWIMRGATTTGGFFITWLKNPVSTPQELEKMLIGSSTGGKPAVEAWKGAWIQVESNDSYTAMEQGVSTGIAGQPWAIMESQSMAEVANYAIEHTYYKGTAQFVMNLDKWNSLPPHLQDLITETVREVTPAIKSIGDEDVARCRQGGLDAGMEYITFSPEDAEWYVQSAYDYAWDQLEIKFPEDAAKLREYLAPKKN